MNRCIRCDTEHNLSERGLCPSCEFIVTAGLPPDAPVAPTSADVPLPKAKAWLDQWAHDPLKWGAQPTSEDFHVAMVHLDTALDVIDRLTAANAALQAKVDALTPKPVDDDIQHVICQHSDCLSPVADGSKMFCERHILAPNGGETAAGNE